MCCDKKVTSKSMQRDKLLQMFILTKWTMCPNWKAFHGTEKSPKHLKELFIDLKVESKNQESMYIAHKRKPEVKWHFVIINTGNHILIPRSAHTLSLCLIQFPQQCLLVQAARASKSEEKRFTDMGVAKGRKDMTWLPDTYEVKYLQLYQCHTSPRKRAQI